MTYSEHELEFTFAKNYSVGSTHIVEACGPDVVAAVVYLPA